MACTIANTQSQLFFFSSSLDLYMSCLKTSIVANLNVSDRESNRKIEEHLHKVPIVQECRKQQKAWPIKGLQQVNISIFAYLAKHFFFFLFLYAQFRKRTTINLKIQSPTYKVHLQKRTLNFVKEQQLI